MNRLASEFEFLMNNHEEMVEKYDRKIIALKDGVVLGAYDNYLDAAIATRKEHERGTVLIQQVREGNEIYTATFNSPMVTFS